MAKVKNLPLEELYPHCEALTTGEQIALKEFLEKALDQKAKQAEHELTLINGGVRQVANN